MLNNKGISLIVLIITIVVIVILTGAIVLNIVSNNPIEDANQAATRTRFKSQQELLSSYISNQYTSSLGNMDLNGVNVSMETDAPLMRNIFTGINDTELQKIDVHNGQLRYIGTNLNDIAVARKLNLNINTIYSGAAGITKPTLDKINKNEGTVETWVNITDSLRQDISDQNIFSTYVDEKYTNTIVLRHTRDNTWQAIISSDYNLITDISVADNLSIGWHSIAIKWSASEFSLYIDGAKAATKATPTLISVVPDNMYIGTGPRLNLVENGYVNIPLNTDFNPAIYYGSDSISPPASMKVDGNVGVYNTDLITVDPNKSYTQKGSFKSVGIGGRSYTYYGIRTYDGDKQYIDSIMTNHYVNTETELVSDLKSGDTIAYVKNASNWKKSADSSSFRYLGVYNYKDYPVYTYTRNYYQFSDSNSTTNTITLTSAYAGTTIPAGTKVANNNNSYGGYTYNTLAYVAVPDIWTTYTSTISGNTVNQTSWGRFRYGTKYIRMLFLLNYGQSSSYSTLFDDIEFYDSVGVNFGSNIQEVCISKIARSDNDIASRYKSGILTKDSDVTYMLTD